MSKRTRIQMFVRMIVQWNVGKSGRACATCHTAPLHQSLDEVVLYDVDNLPQRPGEDVEAWADRQYQALSDKQSRREFGETISRMLCHTCAIAAICACASMDEWQAVRAHPLLSALIPGGAYTSVMIVSEPGAHGTFTAYCSLDVGQPNLPHVYDRLVAAVRAGEMGATHGTVGSIGGGMVLLLEDRA